MNTETSKSPPRFTIVGSIDLGTIPGTTPATRLKTLVQRAGNRLSVSYCGRGIYQYDSTIRERSCTVACRPPKADDPTGLVLNVYDEKVLEILNRAMSQTLV